MQVYLYPGGEEDISHEQTSQMSSHPFSLSLTLHIFKHTKANITVLKSIRNAMMTLNERKIYSLTHELHY